MESKIPVQCGDRPISSKGFYQLPSPKSDIPQKIVPIFDQYTVFCTRVTFSKSEAKGHQKDLVCSICLDDFQDNSSLIKLPCSHLFHVPCIKAFLNSNIFYHAETHTLKKPFCPYCRIPLEKELLLLKCSDNFEI